MSNPPPSKDKAAPAPTPHFIRNIIDAELAAGRYGQRRWSGQPGLAPQQLAGGLDPARIRTRFPPEPNGYLHFGHAKSIFLNFGLARHYGGRCHLRFDDTNPEKEEKEYVDSIIDAVRWLGFSWQDAAENNLYYASNYFDAMIACADYLIAAGLAYVDSQSADEMRARRGTLKEAGQDSPDRNRSVAENQALFARMRAGEFTDGAFILRAKIDMASPNINLRDPAIYRIRHATHHNTGDQWCVYPMYTFAHPIEDALENITHSICTLEFEDQRPFYDWLLEHLAAGGLIQRPAPQQIEFSRLNLTYIVLSKRKLIQLVEEKHVSGWDDPRLPTLAGARRRGYAPEGFHLFAERIGLSKSDSLIDYTQLEDCMREVLNESAERRFAVLDPLKLIIDNYPAEQSEDCRVHNHPFKPEFGTRAMPFGREVWIEREDFMEVPSKGYRRLFPGNLARLRHAYVIECTGCDKDEQGRVIAVHANYLPDSKSGTPGSDTYKVKGNLHWVSLAAGFSAEIRLYDRLFSCASPGAKRAGDSEDTARDFLDDLNPQSIKTIRAWLEPSLKLALPEQRFQFERHGYFVADRFDAQPGAPVFNRTVTLKDSWGHKA